MPCFSSSFHSLSSYLSFLSHCISHFGFHGFSYFRHSLVITLSLNLFVFSITVESVSDLRHSLLLRLILLLFRGSGEDGQLGLGTDEEKELASVVEALEPFNVRSVVGGSRNSLAICDDGKVTSLSNSLSFSLSLLFLLWWVSSSTN